MCFTERLLVWSNVAARHFDWSDKKRGHVALVMNLKKYLYSDFILLQWPASPPWLPPVLQNTLLFCTG